jgi:hemerythrin-like domain-containing protein
VSTRSATSTCCAQCCFISTYIDEFPERLHHPKESRWLFPRLARTAPELGPLIERLEREHQRGELAVRELQHLLLAWELMGESRRTRFMQEAQRYVDFYLEHMHLEEAEILPAAQRLLDAADWAEIDQAFRAQRDPLASAAARAPGSERLFARILMHSPVAAGNDA